MFEQLHLDLDIIIRYCEQKDLHDLEWFGLFADQRESFNSAFDRHLKGENIMLVAEVNHFPVGQVWIDLTKGKADAIGGLWALRVLTPFQNLGIGPTLIRVAEGILQSKDYRIAEIGVAKNNSAAKRLYERAGYQVVRDNVEEWDYTTLQAEIVHVVEHEWIMHKKLG